MYKMMNCVTKKIENATINEIEEILTGISDKLPFVTKARRYGMVEVLFEKENTAKNQAMENLKMEK